MRLQELVNSSLISIKNHAENIYDGKFKGFPGECDLIHNGECVGTINYFVSIKPNLINHYEIILNEVSVKDMLTINCVPMPNVENLLNELLNRFEGKKINL